MTDKLRPAAFFDFDRTLIDVNSGLLFAKYEHKHGRLSTLQFMTSFYWGALYHFGFINIDKAYHKAVSLYIGQHTDFLEKITRDWFLENILHRIQPGALLALEEHRKKGHPLVLVTNSSCYLSQIVKETWNLDGWLANTYPLDENGCITGELELPLCYGQGKVVRTQSWAEENGVSLEQSWFYSDSISDLAMLERVKTPMVVNPDPRLKRVAIKRSWPILDWRK
jgi:HAD superfamily hydrolase (TIGR01490 family)